MLFTFYNVEPVLPTQNTLRIESISRKNEYKYKHSPFKKNKNNLVHSTMNTIRERIFQMTQLFFLKRDLTGSMGLLRHFSTDMVNSVIEELTSCELIRQGREY